MDMDGVEVHDVESTPRAAEVGSLKVLEST